MSETLLETSRSETFRVSGLTCADCAAKLEQQLRAMDGVDEVTLNFMAAKLTVRYQISRDALMHAVSAAGYQAVPAQEPLKASRRHFLNTHRRAITTILSGLLLLTAWILSHQLPLFTVIPIYIGAILVGGLWTIRRGLYSLRHGTFDMNALMTIAVIGASILGDWNEAASVAVLYSISNMLESYTMERTRQSIRGLMEIAPREALVRRDGQEVRLPVESIDIGDIVIIKPGEKIAVDGVIMQGVSAINQAAITGESLPVEKSSGDDVYAGTLNTTGALEVCVTKTVEDTALAHIIHLVEEAQAQRAPSQSFVDRFARVYTPIVLATAAVVALLPPLVWQWDWHESVYRALALIVVACPCALVISTPVAIVSAIGNAARHGVLIKGGAFLEQLGRLSVIAFDKTGTLTTGRPTVTDVIPLNGLTTVELLQLAASIESRSSHVLADAIVRKARDEEIILTGVETADTLPGRGARATLHGHAGLIGNKRFFLEEEIDFSHAEPLLAQLEGQGKTAMLVGLDSRVVGVIAAEDRQRPHITTVIRDLHHAGIQRVALLTGDHRDTAERLAARLGIDDVRAELLPEDKAVAMRGLLEEHGMAGMVGDGINDAPALATATVGIAMGVAGTDTALETADVTLMSDDLEKLPYTVRLSRKTLGIIRQNIIIALTLKLLAILLIFPGWLTLWMAVTADMGASIIVTLNGLRLIRGGPLRRSHPRACSDSSIGESPGHCADGCCGT